MNKLTKILSKPFTFFVDYTRSMVEILTLMRGIKQELASLRNDVSDIKQFLANQEELAKQMIEKGEFLIEEDDIMFADDIDDKDIN